ETDEDPDRPVRVRGLRAREGRQQGRRAADQQGATVDAGHACLLCGVPVGQGADHVLRGPLHAGTSVAAMSFAARSANTVERVRPPMYATCGRSPPPSTPPAAQPAEYRPAIGWPAVSRTRADASMAMPPIVY